MVNNTVLLEQKKGYFVDMLDQLSRWDNTFDSAQMIIMKNQNAISEINVIDKVLSSDARDAFIDANRELVETVLSKQRNLVTFLQDETNALEGQMKQLNQKNKVVSHYMNKDTSLFVDRDV